MNFILHPPLYWNFMKQLHTSFFRHKYRKQHGRNINSENCVCFDRFLYFLRTDIFSVILQFPKRFCWSFVLYLNDNCTISYWARAEIIWYILKKKKNPNQNELEVYTIEEHANKRRMSDHLPPLNTELWCLWHKCHERALRFWLFGFGFVCLGFFEAV